SGARADRRAHRLCFFHSSVKPLFSMRCSASSNLIINSPIFARASVSSRSSGSLRLFNPRVPCSRNTRFHISSSFAGTWLSRETASSGSPRIKRSTSSVLRCTLQRSGSSMASGAAGSLPGDVDFRRLSAMPDLLGCRHRSRCENGVQGIRVRFIVGLPGAEADRGRLEVVEAATAPEFFPIDPMATFDLAVLLRAARFDIAVADPPRLDGEREGKRELLPVVTLQPTDPERKRATELGEKREARALV